MQKTLLSILVLILVSCTAPASPTSTPTIVIPTIQTAEVTSTAVATDIPTNTTVPLTPTVDLAHLPTSTPQPAASCPSLSNNVRLPLGPVFKDKKAPYHDAREVVLNYLNQGGDPIAAVEKLTEYNVFASTLDLTHDGVFEFILPSGYFTVFGCRDGNYVNLLDIPPSEFAMTAVPLVIQDLNQNGLLELLIGQVDSFDSATYRIFEWNGEEFANIGPKESLSEKASLSIDNQVIHTVGESNAEKGAFEGNWEIKDTDGNGLKDIILRAGVFDNFIASSTLEDSLILKWDGKGYAVGKLLKEATPTSTPTATPLPFSATCSVKVPELRFQKPEREILDSAILDYLNAGGMPEKLGGMTYAVTIKDLNDDAAPEIILRDFTLIPYVKIFTCQSGKYIDAVKFPGDLGGSLARIMAITDNNKNGVPEVFVEQIGCVGGECGALYVVEWENDQFVQKLKGFDFGEPIDYTRMDFPQSAYLKDVDGDGIAEVIWKGEVLPDWHGDHWTFYPQRLATHIYKWNGTSYTEQLVEYSTPQYRFQAVQDGDRYAKAGFYEKALSSYQLAITSNSLEWWITDLYNSIVGPHGIGPCAENAVVCPKPTQDPNERPTLSAYAYFKIMIVHLLAGNTTQAEIAYQNLLTAHPVGTPGYKITEAAISFRDEFQATQDVAKACTQFIASIKRQPDILAYLTGGYNGFVDQGFDYERNPDEVCPFK